MIQIRPLSKQQIGAPAQIKVRKDVHILGLSPSLVIGTFHTSSNYKAQPCPEAAGALAPWSWQRSLPSHCQNLGWRNPR